MRFASRYKVFLGIILLSLVLRFYHLGSNPISLNWDEVSQGYNAYSILETGADEYGNVLPFSIRSFNDYKPPLNTYLMIPSIVVFGLNSFAVRLPSAIAGVVAVGLMYVLVREIFWSHKKRELIALVSAGLLAISPWHLQFSRGAFEANIALTFYLTTIVSYLIWLRSKAKYKLLFLLGSAVSAAATLYAYHSARLVLPLMLLVLVGYSYKSLFKRWKQVLPAVLIGGLLAFPFIFITFFRAGSTARFTSVSYLVEGGKFSSEAERFSRNAEYFNDGGVSKIFHHRYMVMGNVFLRNYLDQFNVDFLFTEADNQARHHAYGMGLLYLIEAPFLVYGMYSLIRIQKVEYKKIVWALVLLGPIPAALTDSTPHAIRSLLMLPGLVILVSIGLVSSLSHLGHLSVLKQRILYLVSCLLFLTNVFYYLNSYYVISPYYQAKDWQYGYEELYEKLGALEDEYDQIIVTNKYDQPHIFYAFYNKINPKNYQQYAETAYQSIGKYSFKRVVSEDYQQPNTLIVAPPDETTSTGEIVDTIYYDNGDVVFNIIRVNP